MINENKRTLDQTRLWIVITCVVLILAISICVLFSCQTKKTLPKDEIRQKLAENDLSSYSYVADALFDSGISVNKTKLKYVEDIYAAYYYKELPPMGEFCEAIAELFLTEYYDVIDVTSKKAVTDAILRCYTRCSGDKYSDYFTAEEYAAYLGDISGSETKVGIGVLVTVNYLDNTIQVTAVLPGSAAEAAGVKRGDLVVGVDGERIEDLGAEALMVRMAGEVGTEVKVTVLRGDEELTLTAVRAQLSDITVVHEMLDGNIAYIQVIQFKETTFAQFKEAVDAVVAAGAQGIVFDMRNNPGGLLDSVVDVIDYIAPDGKRIASYTMGKYDPTVFYSDDGHSLTDLPITVLCNGNTASAGELFTAAMRDYGRDGTLNVSIVGEVTHKKGIMQQSLTLSDGSGIKLTVAFYNPPCDINYDGVGVVPNCPVINEGESDDQLIKAIEEINRMLTEKGQGI